tara:strand:- start:464 stop:907 length:444 start_codon:yes stop_codon:yes gene_type:complete
MEVKINCPVCYSTKQCLEEKQKDFSSYLCFKCGYMSDSRYEIGSLAVLENINKSPKLVQDTVYEDKSRNIVWLLSVINMGQMGMIYPEGSAEIYEWKYAKVVTIPEEERKNYDGHVQRLDVENAKSFHKYDFLAACDELGMTKRVFN